MKAVITPAYLPNIYYLSWLLNQEKIFFTADTHYQKQTYRNRCEIYGPNGKLKLTIPITHKKAQLHQKENEAQIAFVSAWQKQHWKSLCAAYRSSPYFEFYEDDIHPFYTNKTALLLEFNLALLEKIMALIEFPFKYELISWDPSLHYRMDGLIEAKKKKVTPTSVVYLNFRDFIFPLAKKLKTHYFVAEDDCKVYDKYTKYIDEYSQYDVVRVGYHKIHKIKGNI
ncbi:MAG: WbqC family protein, partial [Flavobacteriaceae bacterium]